MLVATKRKSLLSVLALGTIFVLYTLHQPYSKELQIPWLGQKHESTEFSSSHLPTANNTYIDWSRVPQRNPVHSIKALPTGCPKAIPLIQYVFPLESPNAKSTRLKRLQAVKKSFEHTWNGYKQHAWMKDEVSPISGGSRNSFGGWAATLVDSLDTLWIMGLEKEFKQAVSGVREIDFSRSTSDGINIFETTIRYLGGFLSAYDLSREEILLVKARELGEMLYHAFDTPNRMPKTPWYWKYAIEGNPQEAGSSTLVAEIGSLSLEFTRLSQLSEDPKFYDAIERITELFASQQNKTQLPGMWPMVVNAQKGDFSEGTAFTLGAMSDSLYEYLPKQYLLLGGLSDIYRSLYENSMNTAMRHSFFRPMNQQNLDILVSSSISALGGISQRDNQGQHLVCFVGGMVGMGAKIFERDDLLTARKLTDGCIWAYESMPSGIMPETFYAIPCGDQCQWNETLWRQRVWERHGGDDINAEAHIKEKRLQPGFIDISDPRYMLRPEAIESVFIMYRITGDPVYQEKAWSMFQAIEKHSQTDIAHAALEDVTVSEPPKADKMESFWPAETLKYFYLIFSNPDVISLDDYVFNTEAHPLRRPRAKDFPIGACQSHHPL